MPIEAMLLNAARTVREDVAELLRPAPPVNLNRWAAEHLVFGAESPFPGRYNPDRLPFFRRPFEVLSPDDPVRVVTMMGSAQVGKTMVAQVFLAASLDLDPGLVLYVHPTESNATRWARTKWRPMIRSTPRLGQIFDLRQSKEGGNSTLYQERRDGRGSLIISGANSVASLSMISAPRQVEDDLSKWEDNEAGDPEYQAENRSKAFDWAKILKLSTPTLDGSCRITRAFKAGTQEHFHVPCPQCGHRHPLEPENFIATLDEMHPEQAGFHCPSCGGLIEERHRAPMVADGEWVAHNPAAAEPSFTIWAAYAPFESWERIARAWLAARGDPKAEQVWWNDTAGRAYELPGEAPSWEELRARAEAAGRPRGIVPSGALLLTLTFDCQDTWIDGAVIGWGRDLKRWIIDTVRVEGHISEPECQAELDRLVDHAWPAAMGAPRRVDLAGVDGNAWTGEVLDWVRRHAKSRVIMLRGVGGDQADPLAVVRKERRRDGQLVKYQGRFFNVGVNGLKGGLYKFLRIADRAARGYVDFPAGLDDEYYAQLTAEKRVATVDRKGFSVFQWIKPRTQRNEQLDIAIYGEACAIKLGWRVLTDDAWTRLWAVREAGAPAPPRGERLGLSVSRPALAPEKGKAGPIEAAPAPPGDRIVLLPLPGRQWT
jgi:phage terminase large subunit GpA-like protein